MNLIEQRCQKLLCDLQEKNLYRTRLTTRDRKGVTVQHQQQTYLSFNSNDYLGHAQHPEIIATLKQSTEKYGIGSGGSPLLGGHHPAHEALEEALAEFTEQPKVLLFSTGFSANLSTLLGLIQPQDHIFQDRFNHASLIDAGCYSQAKFNRYHHLDYIDLEKHLKKTQSQLSWIVTDGVFSVDGDIAPLNHLVSLSKQYQTGLIVDDAHGIGILGKSGKGILNHFELTSSEITLLTGSFGIAFGTMGAFAAGSKYLVETLIQLARGYIYTTAIPPAIADATRTSLKLLQAADDKRAYLKDLILYFQTCANKLGLNTTQSNTPIQTLLIKDNLITQRLANSLKQAGILVGAIRPPTVPKNTARLRITLTCHHTRSHIDRLLDTLVIQLQNLKEQFHHTVTQAMESQDPSPWMVDDDE